MRTEWCHRDHKIHFVPAWHEVRRRRDMDHNDKCLRYSMQVGYLRMLLKEKLLSKEEYEKCSYVLRQDYGIAPDILAHT